MAIVTRLKRSTARILRGLTPRKWVLFVLGVVLLDGVLAWKILDAEIEFGVVNPPALGFSGSGKFSSQGGSARIQVDPAVTLSAKRPTSSSTPFLPQTYTPTPSATLTPTLTPTPTPTSTNTLTPTPTTTLTPSLTPEPPTPVPPTAVPLPDSAVIPGVSGRNQSLPLSCESRSAVDWAHFFGYSINELEFQYALPPSDNPEVGFVGNPRDDEGRVPPHSYGVYAGPVAALLRSYGVPARSFHGLGFDDLRREVAGGRPVIVWVVGGVFEGKRVDYTASDGQTVPVVPLEHTVMVVGYSPQVVVIQDGGMRYQVSVKRFRSSWRVLGNQAIFAD